MVYDLPINRLSNEMSSTRSLAMNKKIFRILNIFLLLLTLPVAFGGCNTTKGLGQDIKELGSNIEEEAEEKKKY